MLKNLLRANCAQTDASKHGINNIQAELKECLVHRLLTRILLPVSKNVPLFIISFMLLGAFQIAQNYRIYHTVEFSEIAEVFAENIFMSYLICLCSYLLRKIHLKVFFYIVLFIIYTVSCYLLYQFNSDIAPNILLLLFETNSKEISGFFQTYFMTEATFKTAFFVGILLTLAIVGEHFNKQISAFVSKRIPMCILSVILVLGFLSSVGLAKKYWDLIRCKRAYDAEIWIRKKYNYNYVPIPNLCYSIAAIRLAGKDLDSMVEATEKCLEGVKPVEGDSLNIILVIGESYNKYHASLYGYPLDTTPYMNEEKRKGNLHAFTQVDAPFNMTSVVLKNMYCCNSVFEGERWYEHPFFPAIFKKAGFDVWLWDNQYQTNPNMPWNFTLNSIIFNDKIQQLSYTAMNENCYTFDDDLITDFEQRKMADTGSHNLVIFHLYGQHMPASEQYPQDKEHLIYTFNDIPYTHSFLTDISRQEIVDYDNATRYNDEVIKHIMDLYNDSNSIIVYFADHGEEVYDYRDYCGRTMLAEVSITPEMLKYQVEIPFVVWAGKKWQEKHPEEWEAIGQAVGRKFSTDNICHLLFHLAGIQTSVYMPERDLLSPKYVPLKKGHDVMQSLL